MIEGNSKWFNKFPVKERKTGQCWASTEHSSIVSWFQRASSQSDSHACLVTPTSVSQVALPSVSFHVFSVLFLRRSHQPCEDIVPSALASVRPCNAVLPQERVLPSQQTKLLQTDASDFTSTISVLWIILISEHLRFYESQGIFWNICFSTVTS